MAAAALLAMSATASAQFTNTGSASVSSGGRSMEAWNTFYLQYNPITIVNDNDGAEDLSASAISVGYNKTFGIAQGTPLFIEAGIAVQYAFATWSWDDDLKWGKVTSSGAVVAEPEEKLSMFSAKIPVSLMYRFDLSGSSISLAPYAGFDLRYNVFGSLKTDKNVKSGYTTPNDDDWEQAVGTKVDKDLFDKKDMGSKDNTCNHFQLGWHIGLNAYLGQQFMAGISYGSDFSELFKKAKMNTTSITLGYCF